MGLKFQKTMLLRSKLLRVERDLRGCDLRVAQMLYIPDLEKEPREGSDVPMVSSALTVTVG